MSTDVDVRVTEAVYPEALNEFRQDSLDFAIGLIPERWLVRDYKTNVLTWMWSWWLQFVEGTAKSMPIRSKNFLRACLAR